MKTHLNLLPLPFRRRLIVRQELLRWGAACAVAVAVSGIICFRAHCRVQLKKAELQQLAEKVDPLRSAAASNQQLAEQLDVARRRHQLLRTLEGVHPPLQLMGIVSRSVAEKNGTVQVRSLAVMPGTEGQTAVPGRRGRQGATRRVATEASSSGQLSLQGVAADEVALTEFVNDLRAAGFFLSVELRSSSSVALQFDSARQYSVECRF